MMCTEPHKHGKFHFSSCSYGDCTFTKYHIVGTDAQSVNLFFFLETIINNVQIANGKINVIQCAFFFRFAAINHVDF